MSVGEDIAANGKTQYDLGAREVLKAPFDSFSKGKNMPIAHMFYSGGNGILRELKATDDKTEIISEAYTFDKKFLSIAMTRFENSLGGRVVTMGMTVRENLSQSLFNYRRMKLFGELVRWCGAEIPLVKNEPCVHLILNKSKDDSNKEASYVMTLINLGDDTLNGIEVILPENMSGLETFYIDSAGNVVALPTRRTDDEIYIDMQIESAEPLYIIFK